MEEEQEQKKTEEKKIDRKKSDLTKKLRENPWIVSTFALAFVVFVFLIFNFSGGITGNVVSEKTAGDKLVDYLNELTGGGVVLVGSSSLGNLYEVTVSYQGQNIPVYITKDGKYFVSSIQEITPSTNTNTNTESIPKSAKPAVELFVMSFCPYGVKAEQNIFPLIDLLGSKIDFKIRYIVQVNGDTINDVSSLHGINEAKENARQLIIAKYYPDKFYAYLEDINDNCYPVSSDGAKLEACWKAAASKLGIDTAKVETLAYGTEGISLLKAEQADNNKYSVSGSPTLIINGVQSSSIYSGTIATQTAVCSAFTSPPSECGEEVANTNTAAPAGSC